MSDALGRHVLSAKAIFADHTASSGLAPGTGKTRTARLWPGARDQRPWGGTAPPALWYRSFDDHNGQHPKDHIAFAARCMLMVTTVLGITGPWIAIPADTGAIVLVTLNALRLLAYNPE